jgi:hypothetical protein
MPAMPGRVVSRRFIGREAELAQVEEAIAAAGAGTATTIIVASGAGMGVTRFSTRCSTGRPPRTSRRSSSGARRTGRSTRRGRRSSTPSVRCWPPARPTIAGPRPGRPPDPARAAGDGRAGGERARLRASELADPERRQPRALESLFRWLGRVAASGPW